MAIFDDKYYGGNRASRPQARFRATIDGRQHLAVRMNQLGRLVLPSSTVGYGGAMMTQP